MAVFQLVQSTIVQTDNTQKTATTPAITTTPGHFLIVGVTQQWADVGPPPNPSLAVTAIADSFNNAWSLAAKSNDITAQFYAGPILGGAGHTITVSPYPGGVHHGQINIGVLEFVGLNVPMFDQARGVLGNQANGLALANPTAFQATLLVGTGISHDGLCFYGQPVTETLGFTDVFSKDSGYTDGRTPHSHLHFPPPPACPNLAPGPNDGFLLSYKAVYQFKPPAGGPPLPQAEGSNLGQIDPTIFTWNWAYDWPGGSALDFVLGAYKISTAVTRCVRVN